MSDQQQKVTTMPLTHKSFALSNILFQVSVKCLEYAVFLIKATNIFIFQFMSMND